MKIFPVLQLLLDLSLEMVILNENGQAYEEESGYVYELLGTF